MKEYLTEPFMKMDASMVADIMEETWLKLDKAVLKSVTKDCYEIGKDEMIII